MAEKITLRLDDVTEVGGNLKAAAAGIVPEAALEEGWSELETLNRYRANLARMSSLVGSYAELLTEDIGRIHHAVLELLEFDGSLLP